jgi:hypothetical protein
MRKQLPLHEKFGHFVSSSQSLDPEPPSNDNTVPSNMTVPGSPVLSPMSDMDQMKAQIAALTQLVQASIPAPPLTNVPPAAPPVTPGPPLVVPPITQSPTVSVSPSICSLFPNVKAACITSVINHSFCTSNLYKLDSQYHNKETSFSFNGSTHEFEVSNCATKDYKSLNSIILPLNAYFAILSAHIPNQQMIPLVFFQYLSHLQKITSDYEWAAVLKYHILFFNCCWMEMLELGDYSQWADADTGLMSEYVYSHKKTVLTKVASQTSGSPHTTSSTLDCEVCRQFNPRLCVGKCANGRPHMCSTCGKADHGAFKHDAKAT